jgi:hypothetical protein
MLYTDVITLVMRYRYPARHCKKFVNRFVNRSVVARYSFFGMAINSPLLTLAVKPRLMVEIKTKIA